MIFSSFKWDQHHLLECDRATHGYIQYRHRRINLITGFPEVYSLEKFLNDLKEVQLQDHFKTPRVYHFHYELGLILNGLGHFVNDETPLAIVLDYERSRKAKIKKPKIPSLKLKSIERPNWTEYKAAFARIQEHLLLGNCYQVNLTYPFDFETDNVIDPRDIKDFFLSREGVGAYGHVTFLGEEMILSNSPECLFHFENNKLITMPIKGTVKREKNWKTQWRELQEDRKQEGELLMIVDLLRNDLNRLEKPQTKIEKLKAPLLVPGLLHQYAKLSVKIENKLSLLKTLECLFPGGSITGAPKKRVMEIIQEVERYQRGIYCGSTLLCYGKRKAASINIRTAAIAPAERLWRYGAGGGVTLLSRHVDEFQEMESKVASFLTLIKTPGY